MLETCLIVALRGPDLPLHQTKHVYVARLRGLLAGVIRHPGDVRDVSLSREVAQLAYEESMHFRQVALTAKREERFFLSAAFNHWAAPRRNGAP